MSMLLDLPKALSDLRVLVLGDAILDVYLKGVTDRLCREAPAPVLSRCVRESNCGGAANTAINAASLGASVSLMSVVGHDVNGSILKELLDASGISCELLFVESSRQTLAKTRITASDSILLRIDEGSNDPVSEAIGSRVAETLRCVIDGFDAVIVSDYGYGTVGSEVMTVLQDYSSRKLLVVDARNLARYRKIAPAAVKPNYREAISLLDLKEQRGSERVAQIVSAGEQLIDRTGARHVCVTLDRDGALLLQKDQPPYRIGCIPEKETRTVGAGDSFTAAFALALAAGGAPRIAARVGAAAASVVLKSPGTNSCSALELRAALQGNFKWLDNLDELDRRVRSLRAEGKRIVFTNGCFDVLHRGHVNFLRHARAMGDVLLVALNSDSSVRRIKGAGRPINSLADRVEVLAALQSVDCLIAFDEDSPVELIRRVAPEVFVKGSAHTAASIPEAELVRSLGGNVHIIPAAGMSTSQLIQRIQRQQADPSDHRSAFRS